MPGTDRKQLIDSKDPIIANRTSGAKTGGNRSSKSIQTGTEKFASEMGLAGGGPGGVKQALSRIVSRSTVNIDPTDIGGQRQDIRRATGGMRGIAGVSPERAGFAKGFQKGKPIRHDIISDRVGGTDRRIPTKQKDINRLKAVGELKPGESIGNFSIGRETAEQYNVRKFGTKKQERGLFGSAAALAKIFTSKEFQSRKAAGIQATAGAKGRRADAKAKTEKIKALSGVFKNLSETPGENEGLMAKVQEQIQNLISGDSGDNFSGETITRFAEKGFDTDQIKAIVEIMGYGN